MPRPLVHDACPSDPFHRLIPDGDDRPRRVCRDCGFVDYENPKVVVAVVARTDDGVLLCRRAIAPERGRWTLPAGHLERGETAEDGAARELREEAGARVSSLSLLGVYTHVEEGVVEVAYTGRIVDPSEVAPGPESLDTMIVRWSDVPWADLAFPSNAWALRRAVSLGEFPMAA